MGVDKMNNLKRKRKRKLRRAEYRINRQPFIDTTTDIIKITVAEIKELECEGLLRNILQLETPTSINIDSEARNSVHFPMAIIQVNHSRRLMSDKQADRIKDYIMQQIDAIPKFGGCAPKFNSASLRGSYVFVDCFDKASSEWLVQTMADCEGWEDVKFKVVPENDMNIMCATVLVPGPITAINTLFKRFRIQNAGIDTSTWKVEHSEISRNPESQRWFITMDKLAWDVLEAENCWLYMNFTQVQFILINKMRPDLYFRLDNIICNIQEWWKRHVDHFQVQPVQELLPINQEQERTANQLLNVIRKEGFAENVLVVLNQFRNIVPEESVFAVQNVLKIRKWHNSTLCQYWKYILTNCMKPIMSVLEEECKMMLPPEKLWETFQEVTKFKHTTQVCETSGPADAANLEDVKGNKPVKNVLKCDKVISGRVDKQTTLKHPMGNMSSVQLKTHIQGLLKALQSNRNITDGSAHASGSC